MKDKKEFIKKEIKKYVYKNDKLLNNYPEKLYKYRSFDEYTVDMLDNKYLFLSPAENLDDQFDCSLNFDIDEFINYDEELYKKECKEYLKKYAYKKSQPQIKPYIKDLFDYCDSSIVDKIKFKRLLNKNKIKFDNNKYEECMDEVNEKIIELENNEEFKNKISKLFTSILNLKENTGICSLTENKDSQIMWQMYASNYSGYCIEYEIPKIRKDEQFDVLLPVIYKNKSDFDPIKLVLNLIILKSLNPKDDNVIKYEFILSIYKILVTKHKEWELQQEWRLVGNKNYKDTSLIARRIYLGKNISELNKIAILEVAKRNGLEVFIQKDDKTNLTFKYVKIL